MTKPFWKSKTFWFNILGGLIALAQYEGTMHVIDPTVLGGILTVGNLFLRSVTNTGVTVK